MTDGDLVRRGMQGDAASLSELVQAWSGRVLAFCLATCRNRHLAEDLAQEALLRALRNLATLENPDHFGPWLRGIALRVYLDWRKARQTSQVPFSTLDSDAAVDELLACDSDSAVDHADDVNWLMREVATLEADQRETLMLYYSHEMTYAELAELLEVSPATINFRLTKARAILRSRAAINNREDRTVSSRTVSDRAVYGSAIADSAASSKRAATSETSPGDAARRSGSMIEESDSCPGKPAESSRP
jgi:RNA polymerase sigma-70 factor (ECF subfamily)